MRKYRIADLTVGIDAHFDYVTEQCREYETDTGEPDICISVSSTEMNREHELSGNIYSDGYIESVCVYRKLALQLPAYDALLLHSSVVDVNGIGTAFLAASGVGKTTHTLLWKKALGDRLTVVNGDKPIVRRFSDKWYAYGTPWAGKEKMQTNIRTQLKNICFIERSEVNRTEKCKPSECVDRIMQQILIPESPSAAIRTLDLADSLLKECCAWTINCNMSDDAAKTAYNTIFGDVGV